MATAVKDFLVRTPFFGGLLDDKLDRIIAMLAERTVRAGVAVLDEGAPGRALYVVGAGGLVMTQTGESGRQVRLTRLGPGDFFGETGLIEIQPMQFSVRAEVESTLYELTNQQLYRLYRDDIEAYVMVLQNINRELCRRLRCRDERITEIADAFGDDKTQIREAVRPIRRRVEPTD